MIGQPVTVELIKAGFEVTLFARNCQKAKQIFGTSIKVIEGNLQDSDKIRQLLEGQDGLYLNLSVEQKSSKSAFDCVSVDSFVCSRPSEALSCQDHGKNYTVS